MMYLPPGGRTVKSKMAAQNFISGLGKLMILHNLIIEIYVLGMINQNLAISVARY